MWIPSHRHLRLDLSLPRVTDEGMRFDTSNWVLALNSVPREGFDVEPTRYVISNSACGLALGIVTNPAPGRSPPTSLAP
jgi:hypothetical protein